MLVEWMQSNLFLTVALWIALYVSDYALTLAGTRARAAQTQWFSMQGSYELNAYFTADIDRQRVVSVRFLFALAWTTFLLAMSWLVGRTHLIATLWFELILGAMFLVELAIHVRHGRNLLTFRHKFTPEEIQGKVIYSRRYTYWNSAVDLFLFALLYLALFLLVGNLFFVGGALACAALAFRHYRRIKREPLLQIPVDAPNANEHDT